LDRKVLSRAGAAGAILGIVGIGLFVLLWVVLGSAGVDTFMRLVIAVCVPPAVLALVMGIYFLVTRSRTD
jgi:hypothetical protein